MAIKILTYHVREGQQQSVEFVFDCQAVDGNGDVVPGANMSAAVALSLDEVEQIQAEAGGQRAAKAKELIVQHASQLSDANVQRILDDIAAMQGLRDFIDGVGLPVTL